MQSYFAPVYEQVKAHGIFIDRAHNGIPPEMTGLDITTSHLCMFIVLEGSARASYDFQERTIGRNMMAFLMPGHVIRWIEVSEDFVYSIMYISPELLEEMRFHAFTHNTAKYAYQPICQLTNEQMLRVKALGYVFDAIVRHSYQDETLQRKMLLAQMAVGYEFINYYRREQDEQWKVSKYEALYYRFCSLVVEHYKESRELQYYSELLHLTPRHLSKVFRIVSGGMSPSQWIEEYVCVQIKQHLDAYPDRTIQQVAFDLGFCEPAAFHHFFKRVAGVTAKEYRSKLKTEN